VKLGKRFYVFYFKGIFTLGFILCGCVSECVHGWVWGIITCRIRQLLFDTHFKILNRENISQSEDVLQISDVMCVETAKLYNV